jgi:cytosine/uracil/thiamine/allantoin permease
MRILLLAMGGLVVGWLLIQVFRGRREPLSRVASIGATVIQLISYMVIGAAVLFVVFLAWQELTRH